MTSSGRHVLMAFTEKDDLSISINGLITTKKKRQSTRSATYLSWQQDFLAIITCRLISFLFFLGMFRHAQRPCARPIVEELIKQTRSSWLYGLMMMNLWRSADEWLNQSEWNMLILKKPSLLGSSLCNRCLVYILFLTAILWYLIEEKSQFIRFCVFTATGRQLFKSIEQKKYIAAAATVKSGSNYQNAAPKANQIVNN